MPALASERCSWLMIWFLREERSQLPVVRSQSFELTNQCMKRILISVALGLALAANQSSVAQSRPLRPSEKARAERAWAVFFKSFRAAVSKRDREALKKMMVRDFFFSGGGGDDNHDGDTRDEAFKFLDDPQVHGWQAFDKALVKGAAPSTPNSSADGKKYYRRVAPPAARKTTNLATAPQCLSYFDLRAAHC